MIFKDLRKLLHAVFDRFGKAVYLVLKTGQYLLLVSGKVRIAFGIHIIYEDRCDLKKVFC